MASEMGIYGGLVGLKSENVEQKHWFYCYSWRGHEGHEDAKTASNGAAMGRFEEEKVRFVITNALCLYFELCFLPWRGAHFQKNHETKVAGK